LGNIQLLDPSERSLSIVCQQGFSESFLKTFARVWADTTCACGRALKQRHSIFIGDVNADEAYAPYRNAANEAGYCSVLSVPAMTASRDIVGMLSVHHREPRTDMPENISHLGAFAAELIIRQGLIQ
jgi:GAF domain-containing protein